MASKFGLSVKSPFQSPNGPAPKGPWMTDGQKLVTDFRSGIKKTSAKKKPKKKGKSRNA